jgi:hypothetical protein
MKSLDHGEQIELFQSFKPTNLIFFQTKFTFVDLFAGIGGFRIPLEELGGKCLGCSEIDKEAINVYKKNFISYRSSVTFGRAKSETLTVREFDNLHLRHEFLSVSKPPNALPPWVSAIKFDISFPRVTIERYLGLL